MDAQYNGWTNYATWNVALWLDNDYGTQQMMYEWAEELREDEVAVGKLSERIREYVDENNPLSGQTNMYTDILGAALGTVDWYEVAEHYLED